jgi:hypothetical protein
LQCRENISGRTEAEEHKRLRFYTIFQQQQITRKNLYSVILSNEIWETNIFLLISSCYLKPFEREKMKWNFWNFAKTTTRWYYWKCNVQHEWIYFHVLLVFANQKYKNIAKKSFSHSISFFLLFSLHIVAWIHLDYVDYV